MISRRDFLGLSTGLGALLAAPLQGLAASAPSSMAAISPMAGPVTGKIRALEAELASKPGLFLWGVHNDLRHEYLDVDLTRSRMHADAILRHAPMDEYILNALSDWHLTQSPPKLQAATLLLYDTAMQYPQFVHLRAACLIKVGDVCEQAGLKDDARKFYRYVPHISGGVESLAAYHRLAEARLYALNLR